MCSLAQGKWVQVVTRFPPEPNGYLHIGHAKAMFVDFGLAAKRAGKCLLRFDDTNPEAESQEYIDHIKEIVTWLGWSYSAVTHSSDYFDELHAFALRLIKTDKAYVCHQSGEEIKVSREARTRSPWRERPIEESLRLFEDMRRCAPVRSTLGEFPPTITCFLVQPRDADASQHIADWCPGSLWFVRTVCWACDNERPAPCHVPRWCSCLVHVAWLLLCCMPVPLYCAGCGIWCTGVLSCVHGGSSVQHGCLTVGSCAGAL